MGSSFQIIEKNKFSRKGAKAQRGAISELDTAGTADGDGENAETRTPSIEGQTHSELATPNRKSE